MREDKSTVLRVTISMIEQNTKAKNRIF